MAHFFTPQTQNRNGNWGTKYRPKQIEDVVGNTVTKDKVATLLATAKAKPEDLPTTIGITGPTGTGKTTIAKIIASSLNDGSLEDVTEINCGVESGVDAMRETVANGRYAPRSNFRVWILDEVHLLSRPAASALLKIMEEPPPRLVIIWATNETEKVLQTIIGRSYVLNMKPPRPKEMIAYLGDILTAENITVLDKDMRRECLELVALNCDYMPRMCVNMLQGIIDAISSRSAKNKGRIDDVEMKALVREVIHTDAENTPVPTAFAAIAALVKKDWDSFRKTIFSYEGDMVGLVNLMLRINAAVMRHMMRLGRTEDSWTYRVREIAGMKELPEDFAINLAMQNRLLSVQIELRSGTNIDPSLLVPARLCQPVIHAGENLTPAAANGNEWF